MYSMNDFYSRYYIFVMSLTISSSGKGHKGVANMRGIVDRHANSQYENERGHHVNGQSQQVHQTGNVYLENTNKMFFISISDNI